jgi:hypothetical protein
MMRIKYEKDKPPDQGISGSVNPNDENFDFGIWASAVREQMLAALHNKLDTERSKTLTDKTSFQSPA